MRTKWIYIVILAFCWCSCQTSAFQLEDEGQPVTDPDLVPVTVQLSLGASVKNEVGYIPMNLTRAANDTVYTIVRNLYKVVVVKKIGQKWILDQIVEGKLNTTLGKYSDIDIKRNTTIDPFHLELRPGNYRVVFFFNPGTVEWNTDLVSGTVVDDGEGWVHQAVYYPISTHWANKGLKSIGRREVFTGSVDVEIEKTDDLHSAPPVAFAVELKRRNNCFRTILKDLEKGQNYPFGDSEQFVTITLVAQNGDHFPDGLDVWGNPWYDEANPSDTLYMKMTNVVVAGAGIYMISNMANTTVASPYYFMTEEGVHCKLEDVYITGKSGYHHQIFKFEQVPEKQYVLKNDYIDGIVLMPTNKDYTSPDSEWKGVYLQLVDEDPARLFGPYMEWNLSK